jgi:hypothetical protein
MQILPANLPTVRELIDRYIQALGGASAIENVSSRVETGTAHFNGQSAGAEIFTQVPRQRTFVLHLAGGDSVTTYDGRTGWSSVAGGPAREMHDADIEAARIEADLHFPLHIRQTFPELRVEYPEKIGHREAHVLVGIRQDQRTAKLYFDDQSGLLIRLVLYVESPLGLNSAQIDFADYRDVTGVQVPFSLTFSQPGSSLTIQIEDVRQNIPIDNLKFAKPSSTRPSVQ